MKPLAAIGVLASLLAAQAAAAMPHCGDRDTVVAALTDRYSEHHVASGLQSDTGLLEIWASESDGSWTILMTRPDGQTCIMASGTHWLERQKPEMASGEPT